MEGLAHGCHYPHGSAADNDQEEKDESSVTTCNLVMVEEPLIPVPVDKFLSFAHYKRITTCMDHQIYLQLQSKEPRIAMCQRMGG